MPPPDSPRRLRWACVVLAAAVAFVGSAQTPGPAPPATSPDLVALFLARTDEPLTSYKATRRLEARNLRFKLEGWLEASTELDPAHGFRYTVLSEGGSGLIRGRVLRATLEGEAKLIREGEPAKASLTPANYDLVAGPNADTGLARLIIKPKRRDMMLVDGEVLVKTEDADMVRLEGNLSKTPSWWTTKVHVVREYSRLGGIRVPVATSSTAQVRIAGTSEFRMTYRYEMVNGHSLPPTAASASNR